MANPFQDQSDEMKKKMAEKKTKPEVVQTTLTARVPGKDINSDEDKFMKDNADKIAAARKAEGFIDTGIKYDAPEKKVVKKAAAKKATAMETKKVAPAEVKKDTPASTTPEKKTTPDTKTEVKKEDKKFDASNIGKPIVNEKLKQLQSKTFAGQKSKLLESFTDAELDKSLSDIRSGYPTIGDINLGTDAQLIKNEKNRRMESKNKKDSSISIAKDTKKFKDIKSGAGSFLKL